MGSLKYQRYMQISGINFVDYNLLVTMNYSFLCLTPMETLSSVDGHVVKSVPVFVKLYL